MKWQQWAGISACSVLIVSCFMHWTWYPDIQKYFTGFFSEQNYYGKPGKLLCFFAITGVVLYLVSKEWSKRLNLILSGLCAAYAFTSFLRFTSSYDGFIPEKQFGIFLMLGAALAHLAVCIMVSSTVKVNVPVTQEKEGQEL